MTQHLHLPNPFRRIVRYSLIFVAAGLALAYVATAVADAVIWSTEISPTYVFLIVRIVVTAALALFNLIALPFRHGAYLLNILVWSVPVYLALAILHSVTLTRKAEFFMSDYVQEDVAPLSFFGAIASMVIFQASFAWCVLTTPSTSPPLQCLSTSDRVLWFWAFLTALFIVFRNIARSLRYSDYPRNLKP